MKRYAITEEELKTLVASGAASVIEKPADRIYACYIMALDAVTLDGQEFTLSAHLAQYGYTWRDGADGGHIFLLSQSGDVLELKHGRHGRHGYFKGYTTPEAIMAHMVALQG